MGVRPLFAGVRLEHPFIAGRAAMKEKEGSRDNDHDNDREQGRWETGGKERRGVDVGETASG
jgi:hypothetical protein